MTLTLAEAAKYLGRHPQGTPGRNCMHPETLRGWAHAGKIPAAKIGKRWFFISDDLDAWIRDHYKRRAPEEEACLIPEQAARSSISVLGEYESLLGLKAARTQPRSKRS